MTPEHILRDKLRKIEALFAGAATPGEKAAAGAAAERIRARLGQTASKEKSIELKFSISDVWSRQLFIALCRRYGLRPFRHRRMHRQSIMIKAPKSFMEQVLWPEFQELNPGSRGGRRQSHRTRGNRHHSRNQRYRGAILSGPDQAAN